MVCARCILDGHYHLEVMATEPATSVHRASLRDSALVIIVLHTIVSSPFVCELLDHPSGHMSSVLPAIALDSMLSLSAKMPFFNRQVCFLAVLFTAVIAILITGLLLILDFNLLLIQSHACHVRCESILQRCTLHSGSSVQQPTVHLC